MKIEDMELIADAQYIASFIKFANRSTESVSMAQLFYAFGQGEYMSAVHTYDEWRALGRQVKRGEKGLPIYNPNSGTRRGLTYIFEQAQTYGIPYKDTPITEEKFELLFNQIKEIGVLLDTDIQSIENKVRRKLKLKEKDNEQARRSDEIVVSEETKPDIRLNDRTTDRNGRIPSERGSTPVRNVRTIENGTPSESQEIRLTSGGIPASEQLREVPEIERVVDFGGRTDSDRRESDSISRQEDGRISSTEHGELYRGSQSLGGVQSGNGGTYLRGDNQAVCYRLSESDFPARGPKERYADNVLALRTLKKIQSENRPATEEEQRVLVRYVGWGGLAEAFDEHNASWAKEYKELKELLTTEEYESASGSVLNAHFTPKAVIDGIYAGLTRLGVKNARVLEPSCGTGHFIGSAPEDLGLTFDAVELDKTTSDIAKLLYPTAKIQTSGFEDVKIENGTYDVVI